MGRDLPEAALASEFAVRWLDILWLTCTVLLAAVASMEMSPNPADQHCVHLPEWYAACLLMMKNLVPWYSRQASKCMSVSGKATADRPTRFHQCLTASRGMHRMP